MIDHVTCEICKKQFSTRITPTHLKQHNVSMAQYRERFPTAVLATDSNRKNGAVTLVGLIKKHGEEEGKRRFGAYAEKQRYAGCALEYFVEKYGEEEGKKKYDCMNASKAVSLKNQIKKHGEEEGKRRFEAYVEKQRYAGCALEYFVEKYGEEEGKKKYDCMIDSKRVNLENQIKKHGEEEGKKRFDSILTKRANIRHQHFGTSKLASDTIASILSRLPSSLTSNTYHSNKEWFTYSNKEYWFFDLAFPMLKKTIEINGDYWHANPKKYKPDDEIKYPHGVVKAKDVWEKDRRKQLAHEAQGFTILYLWEDDLKSDFENTIVKAVKWITT